MVQCPYCHTEIASNDACFCVQCGASLPKIKNCVKCGNPISLSFKFCPKCGQNNEAIMISNSPDYLAKVKVKNQDTANSYLDIRDGRMYKTVQIGNQEWIAENLRYQCTGASLYNNSSQNIKPYGCLYTWEAAMEAVPSGYRLPTREDFKELESFCKESMGIAAGTVLKSNSDHWRASGILGDRIPGQDLVGFNALPAGSKTSTNVFSYLGNYAYFWTADEKDSEKAYFRQLSYYSERFSEVATSKLCSFSVRVLKNK